MLLVVALDTATAVSNDRKPQTPRIYKTVTLRSRFRLLESDGCRIPEPRRD